MWVIVDVIYVHRLIRAIFAHSPICDEVSLTPGAIPEVPRATTPIPIAHCHSQDSVGPEVLGTLAPLSGLQVDTYWQAFSHDIIGREFLTVRHLDLAHTRDHQWILGYPIQEKRPKEIGGQKVELKLGMEPHGRTMAIPILLALLGVMDTLSRWQENIPVRT
jgi:hypothetical protein